MVELDPLLFTVDSPNHCGTPGHLATYLMFIAVQVLKGMQQLTIGITMPSIDKGLIIFVNCLQRSPPM